MPRPARHVLAVDDDEGRREALAQSRQQAEERAPAEAADEVADEQDAGGGVAHVGESRGYGARRARRCSGPRRSPQPRPRWSSVRRTCARASARASRCATSASRCAAVRRSRSSGPTAPARRRCWRSSRAHSGRTRAPWSAPSGGVGWVPQRMAIYTRLTVLENLRLFAQLEKVEQPADAVRRMLALTGLEERANDSGQHAVRRQPPARQRRRRPARRPAGAAARRAVRRARPAPARSLLGGHRPAAGGTARRGVHDARRRRGRAPQHAPARPGRRRGAVRRAQPPTSSSSPARAPGADLETSVVSFLQARGH